MSKILIKSFGIWFCIAFNICFGLESFDKTIENLVHEKINDNRAIIELNFDSKFKLDNIKQQEDKIESISLSNFDLPNGIFKAKINYVDNARTDEINGKFSIFFELPLAAKFIRFGEIIAPSDIKIQKIHASRLRDNNVLSEKEVIGMQARRSLTPGVFINITDIARPPVIKINDPVNIVYSSNNIELKTSGVSLGSGAIGETIKVKNEDTGAILLGEIINKNTVQVGGTR